MKKKKKRQFTHNLYANISEKNTKRSEYAREKYRNLLEEEKDKKRQYACEAYINFSTRL